LFYIKKKQYSFVLMVLCLCVMKSRVAFARCIWLQD